MERIEFYDAAPWGDADLRWQETNRALSRLIARYLSDLDRVISIAESIRSRLESIFTTLDNLCRKTCPWCPDPCCIINKVWYDFQDLLYLHITNQKIPPGQLTNSQFDSCRYLKHRGCILPRGIRPWSCIQYLCPVQMKRLRNGGRLEMRTLNTAIRLIRMDRQELDDAFVRLIVGDR